MELVKTVETKLAHFFKDMPQLPEKSKKSLAEIWPWIALVFGILQVLSAYALWTLFGRYERFSDAVNNLSIYATGSAVYTISAFDRFMIYIGIVFLLVEGILFLMAFSRLKARQRSGWNLMFLAALLNVVYSVLTIFIRDRGFGSFVLSLVGTAIGFWLLFQVRGQFGSGKKSELTSDSPAPKVKKLK